MRLNRFISRSFQSKTKHKKYTEINSLITIAIVHHKSNILTETENSRSKSRNRFLGKLL